MKEGDILLAALPQSDGKSKVRPVLFLCRTPPFNDFLVCGISTQLSNAAPHFDELLDAGSPDFARSGLKTTSVIRLGFLAALPRNAFRGRIGDISQARLNRLLTNLADFLRPTKPT